jgi:hypothetical protein
MWRDGVAAAHRLTALSVAGNSPCVRFDIPLIEPDVRISRFRLSEKRFTMLSTGNGAAAC